MRLAHAHDRVPGPAASGSGTPQGVPPGPSGPWREGGHLDRRAPRGLSVLKLTGLPGRASALAFPRSAKLRLKRADKREELTSGKGGSGFRSDTLIVLQLVDPGYVVPSYVGPHGLERREERRLRRGVGCPAMEKCHCLAPAALLPILFLKVGS